MEDSFLSKGQKRLNFEKKKESGHFAKTVEKKETEFSGLSSQGETVSVRRKKLTEMSKRKVRTSITEDKTSGISSEKSTKTQPSKSSKKDSNPSTKFTASNHCRKGISINRDVKANIMDKVRNEAVQKCSDDEEDSESKEEEEEIWKDLITDGLSQEFWEVHKIIKYLRQGDITVTVLALYLLQDCKLDNPLCQKAIKESDALQILLNLLGTNVQRCQQGALKVLCKIASNPVIRRSIVCLGGIESMVELLKEPSLSLRCLVAETISYVVSNRHSATLVQRCGGIPYLVEILHVQKHILTAEKLNSAERLELEAARCGALALWSLCKSSKNKRLIRQCGAVHLLGRLIRCEHEDVLVPVVGTLQKCASQNSFRITMRVEGLLDYIHHHLNKRNCELQRLCASAIFKCAEDKESRELFGKQGTLKPLVSIIADPNERETKGLLAAVTGAIWKCALSMENVVILQELEAVSILVNLLKTQPEDVLVNVVGALGLCAKLPINIEAIYKAGGIELLVQLLKRTNQALLINVIQVVGACAEDKDGIRFIEQFDGIRLLWSHLKSRSTEVQTSAAWALCPCVRNAKDSGLMVSSFVEGLELVVNLLTLGNTSLLTAACALICEVAKDENNLGVMTDYGIVALLSQLCYTTDADLQHRLASAIAACCKWRKNRFNFGNQGVIPPLVIFLQSKSEDVQHAAVRALHQLSLEPNNCITMHSSGAVRHLVKKVASDNEEIQEAAADCLKNIRLLAMKNELHSTKNR